MLKEFRWFILTMKGREVMKKIFLKLVVAFSLVILLAACESSAQNDIITMHQNDITTTYVSGDYYVYSSVDSIAAEATDIVRVEILDERVESINLALPPQNEYENTGVYQEAYRISTVNRFRVLEVFKGDLETGDIREVMQVGGELGNENLENLYKVMLNIGDDLVLFLYSFEIENLPLVLLNPSQSAFRFLSSDNDELESLNSQFDLGLRLEDLVRISERYLD